jgi:hypothetical protein
MPAFLITRKNCCDWDLPVFSTGLSEAIIVFTSAARADRYLHDSHLETEHEVSEVTAVELIDIMLAAHEEGVTYVAVNPEQQRPSSAIQQRLLRMKPMLAEFAAELAEHAFR